MTKKATAVPDALLTELERQKKYVDQLPEEFAFPLFNTRYAVESQRQSGYKHTAAAAREIVDNAIEAGATKVHVIFDRPRQRQKHERADSVSAVAFIDNGAGMLPKMARFALTWGGGTHFDDPNFIGKFGFGLPNASINQTRLVEVYTRTTGSEPFTKAVLDIRNPAHTGLQSIPEPTTAPLPDFVKRYVDEEMGGTLEHGTVVVWQQPDRLRFRTPANLKEHLLEDFGITYRYLLAGSERDAQFTDLPRVELVVEGKRVEPVDPLFLTPGCAHYLAPEEGGALKTLERSIPVRYVQEADGSLRLQKVKSPEDLKHPGLIAAGAIDVVIARFPVGFVEQGKDKSPVAHRRLQIRKPRRGMSFVRAGREIDVADVFPKTPREEANNLGKWPMLQSYAYNWGVEVRFSPAFDEPLGIGNDKQTVRPTEDFWRLLAEDEIDKALMKENDWQREERRVPPKVTPSDTPTEAELAMTAAEAAQGTKLKVPDHAKKDASENLQSEAVKRAAAKSPTGAATQKDVDEALRALEMEQKRRKFHVDYVDDPNGPFYTPEWLGEVVVVKINRSHIFYQALYGQLLELRGGEMAKQALDVVLLMLAKAELRTESEDMKIFYETQRRSIWSPGIEPALKFLQSRLKADEIEKEIRDDAA